MRLPLLLRLQSKEGDALPRIAHQQRQRSHHAGPGPGCPCAAHSAHTSDCQLPLSTKTH